MSNPPVIYWEEKAKLCREVAHKQIDEGETAEGVRNLFRMSYALSMVEYLQSKEKDEM